MDQAAPRPRRSGWLRPLLPLGLGAVGLTLLGWALWPRPTPQTVQAETTVQIDGIGEIESLTQQALIAPAESVVARVLPAGVDVDAGALLVELRSEPLRLQIDQERQLQQAETTQARIAQLDVDSRLLQLRADAGLTLAATALCMLGFGLLTAGLALLGFRLRFVPRWASYLREAE